MRNRNPGNIRRSATKYLGEVAPSRDAAFKQFETMAWGYRAMFVLLDSYSRKGYRTIRQMISRYAPPIENHTETSVYRLTDTNPSTIMKSDQAHTPGGISSEALHRHISHHIASVPYIRGLTEWRIRTAHVMMVSSQHNRANLPITYHSVKLKGDLQAPLSVLI